MLTAEQKRTLKLFLRYPTPLVDSSADDVDEVRSYKLRGEQAQKRDRAVALYFHRSQKLEARRIAAKEAREEAERRTLASLDD
jgi:hypothetical protein